MENEEVKLYRKRSDGVVAMQSVIRGAYTGQDQFQEALDYYYEEGYYDTYKEAQEAPDISPVEPIKSIIPNIKKEIIFDSPKNYQLIHVVQDEYKILFESPNEKEMAAFIFYCGHYSQTIVEDAKIILKSPDEKTNEGLMIDAWVDQLMPKETNRLKHKFKEDKNLIMRPLISFGVVKSNKTRYLEHARKCRATYSVLESNNIKNTFKI
jgi:hypothetical protein